MFAGHGGSLCMGGGGYLKTGWRVLAAPKLRFQTAFSGSL
ncbi:hypothetical protein HMPREF9120_00550 [Neisseria sp. oral taxon 020 str. F0370]|nr:hypothetical protein HMPREF9120_00550 [Neisseria sp. oral taxon 020 str. F0370]